MAEREGDLSKFPDRTDKGIRFGDKEGFGAGVKIFTELEEDGPIMYSVAGNKILVTPKWCFNRWVPKAVERNLAFTEVEVIPLTEIPAEQRNRIIRRRLRSSFSS